MIPLTHDTVDKELRAVMNDVQRYGVLIQALDDMDVYNGYAYNNRIDFRGFWHEVSNWNGELMV